MATQAEYIKAYEDRKRMKEAEKALIFQKKVRPSTSDNANVNVNVNSNSGVINLQYIDLSKVALTELRYLVEDLIPSGFLSMIYGDGGNGKSYLALFLAVLIATGKQFLGKAVKPGRVLYIDFELSPELQRQRLEAICKGLDIETETLASKLEYLAPGTQDNIPVKLTELIPAIKADNFDLVIIDSIGAALTGDQEAAKDICSLFQQLKPLGTVLLLDHQPKLQRGDKSSDKSPFGSVYKTNLSRNVWHLNGQQEDNKLNCLLRHKKSNFSRLQDNIGIAFNFEDKAFTVQSYEPGLEFSDHLTLKEKIIAALTGLQATAETIAETTGESVDSIRAKLSQLKKTGIVEDTSEKQGRATIYKLSAKVNNSVGTSNVNVNLQSKKLSHEQAKQMIIKDFNATEIPDGAF